MTHYPAQPQPQISLPQAPARKKPWYLRWWSFTIAAVLVLSCFGSILGGGDEDAPAGGADDTATTTASADEPAEAAEEPAEEAETDYFADAYPVFDAVTESGSGASVITLPAIQGILTASHSGSSNFILTVLDENNAMTELPVNTIGSYKGTTAFGLQGLGGDAASLQIEADGDWEITIAPVADVPELAVPQEGDGDGVYRYTGDAATWQLSHDGDANFIVSYVSDDILGWSLLANEIGTYEGTVPVTAGPGLVVVNADGEWTLAEA
ncbi:hypothetical protein [Glycomyces paridis]|uniref:Uncharacterized protein n=1 Tax=Glycomyces paridis TaxID=2126555 RepID=A0A4S8NWX0_9ACTN|nr:hypothetical protein [Glycomyces paridis]THV22097.1 hypothetical protein E9998_24065 [Glycomyces paridis]